MATFFVKRGDSMPPVIIAMRVAGSDPLRYYNIQTDDTFAPSTNGAVPPSTGQISNAANYTVRFTMTKLDSVGTIGAKGTTGKRPLVGSDTTKGYTGLGTMYNVLTGELDPVTAAPLYKTYLRYDWTPPSKGFDPNNPTANAAHYKGDTWESGIYEAEFEVLYRNNTAVGLAADEALINPGIASANILPAFRRRTFPAAFGDTLLIQIIPDINDKTPSEAK